jgi:hypothetical protein
VSIDGEDIRDWLETVLTPDGVTRILGLIPSRLYGAPLQAPPEEPGELVPWSEITAYDAWPAELPVLDQGAWNACTWFASCQALQYARHQSGQSYVSLDPLYAYLIVTGGRNTGTNILHAAQLIEMRGIPPKGLTESADVREQAARFRMDLTSSLTSWEQILSAVATRRPVVGSVRVGPNYMHLDAEGAMGIDPGQCNHAIFLGGGLKWSDRYGWMIKHAGSWGTAWGMLGFGWYTQAHFDAGKYGEAYVTRAAREDMASDDASPPVVCG